MNGYFPSRVRKGDISFWIDGFGVPDRITSKAYTYTGTTSGDPIYSAKEIVFDGATSKIELGDVGNIKTLLVWLKPDKSTNYIIDLDGGTTTVTLAPALTATGWTTPSYYIDGKSPTTEYTTVQTGMYNFIAITTATAIAASNVVVGNIGSDFLDGTIAGIIGLNVTLTQTEIQAIYNKQVPFDKQLDDLISALPSGLTFFKDFQRKNGLSADYSLGSGKATYTADRTAANSSPGTYITSDGVIHLMPATDDIPRFQTGFYDATGFHTVDSNGNSVKGILIEGQRTNLITKSNNVEDAIYTKTDITASNADVGSSSPDGTSTAPSLTATGANGTFLLASGVTAQTYSVFIKRKTGTGKIYLTANGGTNYTEITTINGWAFYQETRESASQTCGIKIETSGDAIYIWNNQFEAATYASSPIPTTDASLTRNAEVLKYAILGNRTAAQETISIGFVPLGGSFANDSIQRTVTESDASVRQLYKSSTAGQTTIRLRPNGTEDSGIFKTLTTVPSVNISYLVSGTLKQSPSSYTIFLYGLQEGTTGTTAWTLNDWSSGTYFFIGSSNAGTTQLNGIIKNISIHNRELTANEVLSEATLLK